MKRLVNKYILLLLVNLCYIVITAFSQHKGIISGIVFDKDSELPLAGANVVVINSSGTIGVETNANGKFRIEGIPVGRHTVQVSYIGYSNALLQNIDIISGKELQLSIALEELIYLQEDVVIKASKRKDRPQNDMALISARTFSMEETEKFAGSFGDPARMATTFAGVMQGGDQLNEIIIRGNSPAGLLYKIDGFTIPNPTHFSSAGTSGGAISMLNSNTLSNSDFYTGAFPAEFGNALSGVFDLKLRHGNSQKREYLFQVGFNGFELGLEGPFSSKSNATYLINYRYSTLEVFDWIGMPLPVSAVPYFQDLTAKFNIPIRQFGTTSIFIIGGKNHIKFERTKRDTINEFSLFGSGTGVVGINHSVFLINKVKITAGIAFTHRNDYTTDTSVSKTGRIISWYGHDSWEQRIQAQLTVRYKISSRNSFQAGTSYSPGWISFNDSTFYKPLNQFIYTNQISGNFGLSQSYAQLRHRFNDEFSMVAGLYHQYLSISKSHALEPRFGISYDLNFSHNLSAGFGRHSQIQPRHIYFIESLIDTLSGIYKQTNGKLGFTSSYHFVFGHQYVFRNLLRLKSEAYFQQLSSIPVERNPSYFSLINYGSFGLEEGNNSDSLVNKGKGYNYGVELTVERFLSRGYYLLFTASLFESKYAGSDGVWRNTLFNSNFVFNYVGGYELKVSQNHRLSFDIKAVWAGGLRKLPIDLDASIQQNRTVYDYSNAFATRHGNYFRIDTKVSYKLNFSKVTHILAVELINATNRRNHFIQIYNSETQQIEESTQLGLTPLVMYRVVF
jgi:hypothetical protein